MKAYNLDHVGIAVHDLDDAVSRYRQRYGVEPIHREVVESQGVEETLLALGGSFIQLLMPLAPDTPVGRFLARRGEGLHHLAMAVLDIDASLRHLADSGVRLIDSEARSGSRGTRIAFVHPADLSGTLMELVEYPDED